MAHQNTAANLQQGQRHGAREAATAANETGQVATRGDVEAQRKAQALALIVTLRAVWPELTQLTTAPRSRSTGRLLSHYEAPLRALFAAASAPQFASTFALLKVADERGNMVNFDADRAIANLERALAVRSAAASLRALADEMDDDVLHHGSVVVDAGLVALEVARTLARYNPEFRALVGHGLDGFTAMTSAARRAASAEETPDAPADNRTPHP